MSLMHSNPSKMRIEDSPRRVVPLSSVVKEAKKSNVNVPEMNLLDKDERELVRKGDAVTKEEMWRLLE